MCLSDVDCRYIEVYGADEISQDNWRLNQEAAYGIIGVGPGSKIWEGFVDPETKLATYSIEIARSTNAAILGAT